MGKALFITGTGTDVGKTYVTALIVKKLREAGLSSGYYKAALSGAVPAADGTLQPGDALYVNRVAKLGESAGDLVSYVYEDAVSPHLAAKLCQQPIDFARVREDFACAKERCDYLTMEGSGGIICPLRWDATQHVVLDDLVKELDLGVLVVADAGLGTINSTVLTIEHLRRREIPVRGVIFNRYVSGDRMQEDNAAMIEQLTGVKVLACVKEGDQDLDIADEVLHRLYR
ncbi:dethiobiotin synthase [Mitsuokella sp. UBA4253]|uniref:dethiobiotin synthase n=1 Tax=Mitsuokella sp. UBA4253 TaxID=1946959 RepID=UPI00257F51ED|nr:dethiobiotin synthase [Mitsuokella sp. UBA4253]